MSTMGSRNTANSPRVGRRMSTEITSIMWGGQRRSEHLAGRRGRGATLGTKFSAELEDLTHASYHEAVGLPEEACKPRRGKRLSSTRADLFASLAVLLLLGTLARPYYLVLAPLARAYALGPPTGLPSVPDSWHGWAVPQQALALWANYSPSSVPPSAGGGAHKKREAPPQPSSNRNGNGGGGPAPGTAAPADEFWHLWWWSCWGLVLAWHLGATWGLRRSVRPDARVGKGSQHGAVSPAGWHFDKGSPRLAGLADRLRGAADYEAQRTAWVWGGDLRTLLPYLLFRPPAVPYKRRWLRVPIADAPGIGIGGGGGGGGANGEQSPLCEANGKTEPAARFEAVALDVAEPPGGHDPKHPVLLVLAGLTGGSNEGYIRDLVAAALKRSMTVCVMVARGAACTPCVSSALFHGARTSDLAASAACLRAATLAASECSALRMNNPAIFSSLTPDQLQEALDKRPRVYAIGVSMGGIILANYMSSTGSACGLDGAVAVSGSSCLAMNAAFTHARRLWQPLLVRELKATFVAPCPPEKLEERGVDLAAVRDAKDLFEFDSRLVAVHHQFDDVWHYYREMSATM
mmetsp:Transcript_46280/g.104526  ORF Transcript_46280/g.104526 Transcript_46280/m.104526 type:complete len:577 (+) Transcript_46280:254-1984(+)